MNYIELIKKFWRSHEENSFTTTEIAVYFYLIEVCNICQWKNPFKRNNKKIEADLNISFNTLKNARNKLKQTGLLDFKTQNGSPNVSYTLSYFDKVTNEVPIKVTNEVAVKVADEINKTKTKTKEYTPSIPHEEKRGNSFLNLIERTPPDDGVMRNWIGLKDKIKQLKATQDEANEIIMLSNWGETTSYDNPIVLPFWSAWAEVQKSKEKPAGSPQINNPTVFILSRLRKQAKK